jgi:hypothetical protein
MRFTGPSADASTRLRAEKSAKQTFYHWSRGCQQLVLGSGILPGRASMAKGRRAASKGSREARRQGHHLGHSSATVTLNTYSHLFPDAMERVVDGLEETYREALTACRRPELDARVLDLTSPGATHAL